MRRLPADCQQHYTEKTLQCSQHFHFINTGTIFGKNPTIVRPQKLNRLCPPQTAANQNYSMAMSNLSSSALDKSHPVACSSSGIILPTSEPVFVSTKCRDPTDCRRSGKFEATSARRKPPEES